MAEDFPRHDLELPFTAVSFDIEAFDKLAKSHGVLVEVYSAMMCPIGLRDAHDARGHLDHSECSNGFIYTSHFIKDFARFDNRDVVFYATFTRTHPGLSRFLSHWFIWENLD